MWGMCIMETNGGVGGRGETGGLGGPLRSVLSCTSTSVMLMITSVRGEK